MATSKNVNGGAKMPTAEEAKAKNIEKMGEALGAQYSALWQEVAQLHMHWSEFVELFATKPTRIDLLNRAASSFFRVVQDRMWDATLLHIARLTDPSISMGNKDKANLTIQNLPDLIDDSKIKEEVKGLVAQAVKASDFCRDWRNRLIAHRDLNLALDQAAVPLAAASKKQVDEVLKEIANVLNAVEAFYLDSGTAFDFGRMHHGAVSLLYALHDGLRAQEERRKRLDSGDFSDDDLSPEDI